MIGDVRVNALAPATPAFRIRATAARGAFTRDVSQQPSALVVANAGVMRLGGQHHWVVIVNAEFNGSTTTDIDKQLYDASKTLVNWPIRTQLKGVPCVAYESERNALPEISTAVTDIFASVYSWVSKGNVREANKHFSRTVEYYKTRHLHNALSDQLLRADLDRLPRQLWVALIRSTFSIRHYLPSWPVVYDRIAAKLKDNPADADAFFVGLEKARKEYAYRAYESQ